MCPFSGASQEDAVMKRVFRTLAAVAIGTLILVSAAADADSRGEVEPGATRLSARP
jgi:hypothetical protein